MTRADLKASTRKELAEMAKRHHVAGWHAMRKEQLVDALARVIRRTKTKDPRRSISHAKTNRARDARSSSSQRKNGRAANGASNPKSSNAVPTSVRRPQRLAAFVGDSGKNGSASHRDLLIAEIRDPHWIHVRWQLSQSILDRAEAALGVEWHLALPVIRIFDVTDGEATAGTKSWVADVEIQTETDNWYVPVAESPRSYMLQVGYRGPSGKFFTMARSRKMTTPRPTSFAVRQLETYSNRQNGSDHDGYSSGPASAEIAEAVRVQHRQHDCATDSQSRVDGHDMEALGDFGFHVEAEVAIHGIAHPQWKLTLLGEPVDTAADGSFSIQFALAEGRQVIPAVMLSPDGNEQRTIVLAIERNTKHLEPRSLDEML